MARKVDGPEITGQVTHKTTGQAYGPVTVTVSPKVYTDPEMTSSTTSLTTDGTGVFSCYAPPGNYTFTTTAGDSAPIEPVEVLGRESGTGVGSAAYVAQVSGTPAIGADRSSTQASKALQTFGSSDPGYVLDRTGTAVVSKSHSGGTLDAGLAESPCVWWDEKSAKWQMVYTGYDAGLNHASIMRSTSPDLVNWTTAGTSAVLSGSGSGYDSDGCTAPVMVIENGTYYLFYCGLATSGYEGTPGAIMCATATSLSGPWTRQGAMVTRTTPTVTWRTTAVYHPSIVKRGSTYYMFFNAADSIERIGYATATSLLGPWTVDDANSPVLSEGTGWEAHHVGDPFVWRDGDLWWMSYYAYDGSAHNQDGLAYTTDANFPLGWTKYSGNPVLTYSGTSGAFDQNYAGKPWRVFYAGRVYHYYTGGSLANSAIGLAVSRHPDPTVMHLSGSETITGVKTFNKVTTASSDSTVIFGRDFAPQTSSGRTKVIVGTSTSNGDAEFLVGQDSTHMLIAKWAYNSTVGNALAQIETYGGSNQLNVQNNTGNVLLGGSGGKIGFFGKAPVSKPAAPTDTASIIAALQALGLTA